MPLNDEFADPGRSFDERNGSLFIGSFRHGPNLDAVEWLCQEVLPLVPASVRREHPTYIVGDALDDRIRAMGASLPDVKMIGWVPSLIPYLAAARASVLPLLTGAGTKQKMIQSLMGRTAVVSTSIGAEGFDLTPGRDVLIANDAATFAASMASAVTDRDVWERLSTNGRSRIVAAHGRESARAALLDAIEFAFQRPPKGELLAPPDPAVHHSRLVYQYLAGRSSPESALRKTRAARASEATRLTAVSNPEDGQVER